VEREPGRGHHRPLTRLSWIEAVAPRGARRPLPLFVRPLDPSTSRIVAGYNDAAFALYRTFGFVEEGRRTQHMRRANGELWDLIEMGLLL
jgi:ribosomal protein S18 acetylase RimI-like enzyme